MKTFFRIFYYARPVEKYAVPYALCVLIHVVFNMAVFMMIIPLINTLFSVEGAMSQTVTQLSEFQFSTAYFQEVMKYGIYRVFGPDYDMKNLLVFLSFITVGAAFISNLFRFLAQKIMENFRIHTLQKMRDALFENIMRLHVGFFSNEKKGDIISKLTSDIQVVQFCVTNTLQVLFKEPLLIISYFIALIVISPRLTLFTVLVLPVTALLIGFIVKRLRRSAKEAQESLGEILSIADEGLTGIKVVKSYNATGFVIDKFMRMNATYSRIMRSMATRQQMASPVSEFLGISAVAVILIYGGNLVLSGSIDPGGFIAYLGIFSQVTRPARAITDSFATIHQGLAAGERVLGLMDTKPTITDKPDAATLESFRDKIAFQNVSFSYEERTILDGITFTIHKGETVALVGPSGGGKSTIADLLPRYYDVRSGGILIDGIDLRDYRIDSLRDVMGTVSQDTVLFNDTIEQNIRLGNLQATREEVEEAARIANAYDFIMETEHGFETNIGDRGVKLSGGQRQRLSIARAVLKNPQILILDEATSALDTESEKTVQAALNTLSKKRTSLIIAHRLSTVQHADKILVIGGGRIEEQGTHQELMAKKGLYHKLIEMQHI